MKDIRLDILTPEAAIVNEMVDDVTLPGTMGPFQVLKDHAALISSLGEGKIIYAVDGQQREIAIKGGFVEVGGNAVSACVEI